MKRTLLLFIALATYVSGFAQISPAYTNAFGHVLDSVCKKNNIKGVSVAIYRPGEGIWTGVYGESHAGVPITPDMHFPIGSNTKTFIATLILKMQENGLLNINDTIGTWIQHPHVNGQITIKQMLNHTSGLYNYTNNDDFFIALNSDYNKIWNPEDMLQFIDTPSFAAGKSWEYSNTNYLLAGIIISKIMSKPVEQVLRDMILTPQNLNHTYFFPQEQPDGVIPHGWSEYGTPLKLTDMYVELGYTNTAFLSMATTAGAIISTAEDNVKFWNLLMTGKIINSSSLALMKDFVTINTQNAYGLGLFRYSKLNGRVIYDHGGTCFGFLNENAYDSVAGTCITVLSNQDSIDNNMLFTRVIAPLHKIVAKMPPLGITDVETVSAGIYPNPASDNLHVSITGNTNNANVEITNITGRLVYSGKLNQGDNIISLSNFGSGLYIARINTDSLIQTQKIQVIK